MKENSTNLLILNLYLTKIRKKWGLTTIICLLIFYSPKWQINWIKPRKFEGGFILRIGNFKFLEGWRLCAMLEQKKAIPAVTIIHINHSDKHCFFLK